MIYMSTFQDKLFLRIEIPDEYKISADEGDYFLTNVEIPIRAIDSIDASRLAHHLIDAGETLRDMSHKITQVTYGRLKND